jgi:hypothetical protein
LAAGRAQPPAESECARWLAAVPVVPVAAGGLWRLPAMTAALARAIVEGYVAVEPVWKDETMKPVARHEAIEHDERPVHQWRVTQLARLGIPRPLADVAAYHVDWHEIAALVQRGCAPRLALRIVR